MEEKCSQISEECMNLLEKESQRRKNYYRNNKKRIDEQQKRYYEKHKESRLKRMKAYREKKKSQASINEKECGVTAKINTLRHTGGN